jgi:hypothetical protein
MNLDRADWILIAANLFVMLAGIALTILVI